jgi:signal recognition particle subunit SRP14
MTSQHSPFQFLFELGKLFNRSRSSGKGSVLITQKKVVPHATKAVVAAGKAGKLPPHCLFRATLGKKKISTTVGTSEVNKFHTAYATLLKSSMDSLKKKERKPRGKKAMAM